MGLGLVPFHGGHAISSMPFLYHPLDPRVRVRLWLWLRLRLRASKLRSSEHVPFTICIGFEPDTSRRGYVTERQYH